MKNISLQIPAIHCDHCVHTIKMELSEVEGVESVLVDEKNKSIEVAFNSPASEEKIRDLLISINYPPEE